MWGRSHQLALCFFFSFAADAWGAAHTSSTCPTSALDEDAVATGTSDEDAVLLDEDAVTKFGFFHSFLFITEKQAPPSVDTLVRKNEETNTSIMTGWAMLARTVSK